MSGYETRKIHLRVGSREWKIRSLKDTQQYYDPHGEAAKVGICSASWSLFGQLWPASKALARAVKKIDIEGRRFIELGCGLGLPSLVLSARGADVVATDKHPLSEAFLDYNAALNQVSEVPFIDLAWDEPAADSEQGRYDVILGSDLLYEPDHAEMLAETVNELAAPRAKVLITCPGRGYRNRFARYLQEYGFDCTEENIPFVEGEPAPHKGRLLSFRRGF